MISKFLIQGIRAWGIFKNGKDIGYLDNIKEEQYKYNLSDIREVYSTFKYCVYDPIFGSITHDNDKDYNIVSLGVGQGLDDNNKKMLKDMIDQMVNLYTGKKIKYYPRSDSWFGDNCPDAAIYTSTIKPSEVEFTKEAKEEFAKRMNNATGDQPRWMIKWCQEFTGIFGVKPYFATHDTTFTKNEEYQNLEVGKIISPYSGGKSTRRARTKKARRAKRHTRRAARREYRGR